MTALKRNEVLWRRSYFRTFQIKLTTENTRQIVMNRVRRAKVVLEMMNGRPLVVLRFVFNMLTFKSDGMLL